MKEMLGTTLNIKVREEVEEFLLPHRYKISPLVETLLKFYYFKASEQEKTTILLSEMPNCNKKKVALYLDTELIQHYKNNRITHLIDKLLVYFMTLSDTDKVKYLFKS